MCRPVSAPSVPPEGSDKAPAPSLHPHHHHHHTITSPPITHPHPKIMRTYYDVVPGRRTSSSDQPAPSTTAKPPQRRVRHTLYTLTALAIPFLSLSIHICTPTHKNLPLTIKYLHQNLPLFIKFYPCPSFKKSMQLPATTKLPPISRRVVQTKTFRVPTEREVGEGQRQRDRDHLAQHHSESKTHCSCQICTAGGATEGDYTVHCASHQA